MPKVSAPYDTVLLKTWQGIKKRNVDAYNTGLVHRPKSNMPGDAVSEGVSYGMFLALYSNDQAYFNKIWDAGEKYMWTASGSWGNPGNYYDWRVNESGGNRVGTGPASDAEQDIALLLIFADKLVERGIWKSYTSSKGATYSARAKDILGTIRASMIDQGKYLLPGHWGGDPDIKNPGYFAPASYRVFAEYDSANKSAWMALVDGSYELIAKSPGYGKGLVPDWFTMSGGTTNGAGYNAFFRGDALYRDAIRVYWRLATDYIWYKEPRAKAFLDKAMTFIDGLGGAPAANFFDMTGSLLPADSTEVLGDGIKVNIERKRREHSHLTVGMWAAAAMGAGGPAMAESYSEELLKFYKTGTDFWGYVKDPDGGTEDTLHNEMYFDQFLAWFGASVLGGVFTNVWDDLRDGVPTGPPEWKTRPALNTRDIDASKEPLRVGASFSRTVRWTVTIKHDTTGREVSLSGNSDSVNVTWYGLSQTGDYMPQGLYTLTVSGAGINDIYTVKVWLGKPFAKVNLMEGKRLLVDDFADGDLIPYIGKEWTSFYDSDFGQAGASTATLSVKKESDGKEWLSWAYKLDAGNLGFEPYAGLDWSCKTADGKALDITGVDTLIFKAKTASGSLSVSVQLVSADFNFPGEYQYFSDSIVFTASSKDFVLPLKNFSQRRDGNGKEMATTLKTLTSIRFQVQEKTGTPGTTGTLMLERMYFAGKVSNLYTPPPEPPAYVPPTVSLEDEDEDDDPPIIGVAYRDARSKYTIKRSANAVMITLPANMSGASAALIDIRGRAVMRLDVRQDGRVSVPLNAVARGLYFVDIRGRGQSLKIKVLKSR
jgi:endo-1,4-beta-D-glucanase Y